MAAVTDITNKQQHSTDGEKINYLHEIKSRRCGQIIIVDDILHHLLNIACLFFIHTLKITLFVILKTKFVKIVPY